MLMQKLLKMQIQHFERLLKLLYQKKKNKVFKHTKKKNAQKYPPGTNYKLAEKERLTGYVSLLSILTLDHGGLQIISINKPTRRSYKKSVS